jgi:hypothetical protein
MKITIFKYVSFLLIISLTLCSCGTSDDSITVDKEPTDKLIQKLGKEDYSIVLNDMNITENSGIKRYQHKYNVLQVERDSLVVDSMDWKTVNRPFFEKHENDLGMELVSHHNGKLSRVAQPVGFGWAIGNEKYGNWEEVKKDSTAVAPVRSQRQWRSNGTSFLFLYWMMRRPAYQRNYNGYRSASANGKPYYGTGASGTSQYGTRSTYQKSRRPSFFSRKNTSSTWSKHTTEKTKRSSSRYKSSSRTRSRSGGFGK